MHLFEKDPIITTTCCFTGHRPEALPWKNDETTEEARACKKALEEKIVFLYRLGYRFFITGMARGIDLLAGETVLKLREQYPAISLCCAVPYRGQEAGFPVEDQRRYHQILNGASQIDILEEKYTKDCLLARNRYMVDRSEAVIAVYNQSGTGGTFYTVKYALKKNRQLHIIHPESFSENPYRFF